MRSPALLIGFISACWSAPSSPAQPVSPSARRTFYAPDEPFAVAMDEGDLAWDSGGRFDLCPIAGRTFVCGMKQLLTVEAGQIRRAPELSAGLSTRHQIEQVLGTWPGEAWLIARVSADDQGCYRCSYLIYRWRGDRWHPVEELTSPHGVHAVAWRGHLVLLEIDDAGQLPPTRKLTVLGAPELRLPHAPGGCDSPWALSAIGATATTLFATWSSCGYQSAIERWDAFGVPGHFEIVDPGTSRLALAAVGSHAMVAHGTHYGDNTPFLLRFDGERWRPHMAPPKRAELGRDTFDIVGYARAPDGHEWALVDGAGSELWARSPGRAWQPVDTWRDTLAPLGEGPRLMRLAIADDSVWLHAIVETDEVGDRGVSKVREVLLRTGRRP